MKSFPFWPHTLFPLLLLGAGIWDGYYTCDHNISLELVIFSPFILSTILLLAAFSLGLVPLTASRGWRGYAALLHLVVVLAAFGLSLRTPSLGKWIWEKRVLGPRAVAMRQYVARSTDLDHTRVIIDGYAFDGCQRVREGTLFYTQLMGGPFVSQGIFIPASDDWRKPELLHEVTPASVPGLYWFVTND